jgi:nucleoside-diphosphate-sugar epimerase
MIMKILVIGGSGDVGTLMLPHLAQHHQLRVLDLRPPVWKDCEYIEGNLTDPQAVERAVQGMDALIFMAMGNKYYDNEIGVITNFDVNVKGVYLALYMAHRAGIKHAVYTSTLSVYEDLGKRYITDEEMPPDAKQVYGFTKRLGEEVCRNAVNEWGMSINALRLCFPIADERWYESFLATDPNCATTATDLAAALLKALDYRDGFQAFIISGDYEQKMMNMEKAKRVLGWEPLARPRAE